MTWMSAEATPRPRLVDAPPPAPAGLAIVGTPQACASVVLHGKDGAVTLSWRGGEGAERARGVAPGTYRRGTTRVEAEHEGARWTLTASGAPEATLELAAEVATSLNIPAVVRFAPKAKLQHGKLQLGMQITAPDGRGVSVLRGNERPPVTWRVLDAEGKELVTGKMTWG